jgi:hypothetical protein
MNKHEHEQNFNQENRFKTIFFFFFTSEFLQELRQQFENEKANLLAQWKNEVNLSKSEQNEITQQLNHIKDNYTKQVNTFSS